MLTSGRKRIQRLLAREDFARNPLRAVAIRVWTRIAPKLGAQEFSATLDGDITIHAPYSSSPGKAIRYIGVSEPETLATIRRLLVPDGVFVDVGAHIGEYALLAAKHMGPASRVVAFEPGTAILPYLERNVRESMFVNQIQVFPYAIGDHAGTLEFDLDADPGHSRLATAGTAGSLTVTSKSSVEVVRLDAILASLEMVPDIVKIDVEGSEHQVFLGMAGLLSSDSSERPAVIFEYLDRTWSVFDNSIEDSIQLLQSFGYGVYRVQGNLLAPVTDKMAADQATSGLDLDLVALLPQHIERAAFEIA